MKYRVVGGSGEIKGAELESYLNRESERGWEFAGFWRDQMILRECQSGELKPCPFCKTDKYLDFRDDGTWVYVRCSGHNAPLLGPACLNKERARAAWNNR